VVPRRGHENVFLQTRRAVGGRMQVRKKMSTLLQGFLWFDNTPVPLSKKVSNAAQYYLSKYGANPTICFVNPEMQKTPSNENGIVVKPYRCVMPGYLWLGVNEEK
jgi:hypothetical protein